MRWISGIVGQCSYGNISIVISTQQWTVTHDRSPLQKIIILEVYRSGNHIAWIQLKRHTALQITFQRLVIFRWVLGIDNLTLIFGTDPLHLCP